MEKRYCNTRFAFLVVVLAALIIAGMSPVYAGGLTAKETVDAQEAKHLYKSGRYEEAAAIFSRLSAAHPEMTVFTRNTGAAFYYLRRPEPALSNLREYLAKQRNVTAEDKREVDRWISEMEKLREQNATGAGTAKQVPSTGQPPYGANGPSVESAPAPGLPVAPTVPTAGDPGQYPTPAPAQPGYGPIPPVPGQPGAQTPGTYPPGTQAPGTYPGQGPYQPYQQPYPGQPPYPGQYPAYPPGGESGQPPNPTQNPVPAPYPYPTQPGNSLTTGPDQQQTVGQSNTLPWIVGGIGAGIIATGGLFTYLSQSAFSDTESKYDPDKESSGKSYATLSFVCYGVGGAAVVAAILWGSMHSNPSGGSVALAPTIGPQTVGASLHLTY
jgi:hypothetical protein